MRWNVQDNILYMLCSCVLGKYSFLLESVPSSNFIKFLSIQCGAAFTWHFSLQIQLSNLFYVPPYLLQSLPSVQSVFRSSIRNHQERATGAKHMGHLEAALNEAPFRYTRVEVASNLLPPKRRLVAELSPFLWFWHFLGKSETINRKMFDCFPLSKVL